MHYVDENALEAKSRDLFSQENLAASVVDVDADAYDNKVVKDYIRKDGSLKTIPAQRKKLEAVLRHVVKAFKVGKRYSEKQVNEILSGYHEDTASLRRELVGDWLDEHLERVSVVVVSAPRGHGDVDGVAGARALLQVVQVLLHVGRVG